MAGEGRPGHDHRREDAGVRRAAWRLRAHQRVHRVPPPDDGRAAAPRAHVVTVPPARSSSRGPSPTSSRPSSPTTPAARPWSPAPAAGRTRSSTASPPAPRTRCTSSASGAATASPARCPNDLDVILAFHGAMRIGAIWVGINRALAPPEKRYLLDDSGSSLLLCDDATARAGGGRRRAAVVVVLEDGAGEWYDALAAAPDAPFDAEVDPYAPAGIAYTSGTTGYPKGAVHSQYNLLLPGAMLGSQPRLRARVAQGRLPPADHPQHAGAHDAAHRAGRWVLGDLRPQRRGRASRSGSATERVDHLERSPRAGPLARRRRRGRTRRPRHRSTRCGTAAATARSRSARRSSGSSTSRCSAPTG